jgi:hypothetical protein
MMTVSITSWLINKTAGDILKNDFMLKIFMLLFSAF